LASRFDDPYCADEPYTEDDCRQLLVTVEVTPAAVGGASELGRQELQGAMILDQFR
jgi:hypothetical protein